MSHRGEEGKGGDRVARIICAMAGDTHLEWGTGHESQERDWTMVMPS